VSALPFDDPIPWTEWERWAYDDGIAAVLNREDWNSGIAGERANDAPMRHLSEVVEAIRFNLRRKKTAAALRLECEALLAKYDEWSKP
jgi:hypothetical protein